MRLGEQLTHSVCSRGLALSFHPRHSVTLPGCPVTPSFPPLTPPVPHGPPAASPMRALQIPLFPSHGPSVVSADTVSSDARLKASL